MKILPIHVEIIVFTLVLCVFVTPGFADNPGLLWQKSLGGSGEDNAICIQPTGEHRALSDTPGEVGRHGIGMGQEPLLVRRLFRLLRLRLLAQRGEELAPGEGEVRSIGEVNVGERGDAEGFLTFLL